MSYKINDGRLKPKKEGSFGAKKPFKAKGRNRKGRMKNSFFSSVVKKAPVKSSKAVRFSAAKYKARQDSIRNLGVCQVCEKSYELDAPHHVVQGIGFKDDRYMINACITCHGLIHTNGYGSVKKSRLECKEISWSNHLLFKGV